MPLDPLQERVARTALALPQARTLALAGGGAMIAHGPVLHPDDLAADKVLALWGRARPRDYFDVAALMARDGHDRLLELAAAKDSGFIRDTFIDALRAIARLGDADWAEDGIGTADAQRLRATFDAWRNRLEEQPSGAEE